MNKTMIKLLKRPLAACGQNASGLVFHTKNGLPYKCEFVGKKFALAVRAAGVNPKMHFHTVRHSFASNMVQNDIPIRVVKELHGQGTLSTREICERVKHENLAEAVRRLD